MKGIGSYRCKYHQQNTRDRRDRRIQEYRIQHIEERISGVEDTIENIDTSVKENTKCKKILTPNIQEIQDAIKRLNLRIIRIDEDEESQLKGLVNLSNTIIKNFPNLKKEMAIKCTRSLQNTKWI
jgi:chromosome segregation ATPase